MMIKAEFDEVIKLLDSAHIALAFSETNEEERFELYHKVNSLMSDIALSKDMQEFNRIWE